MIIERYPRPLNRGMWKVSDPILQEMDDLLDDAELLRWVRQDLKRHYRAKRQGQHSVQVDVTLRGYDQRGPAPTTLNDLERAVRPPTLHRLNDRLAKLRKTSA